MAEPLVDRFRLVGTAAASPDAVVRAVARGGFGLVYRAARVALATALAAGAASAQPSSVELARSELIREAEEAARRGDHARAVERARRAVELRATPSVQHFLAREHEALDHPLEALAFAAACERGAGADPALRNRDALLRACRDIATRVTTRVGRVVVRVAEPLPRGLLVRVAGSALPEALLGVPYPVAPGVVHVEAEAPGHEPARQDVTVEAGRVEEVPVALSPTPPPTPRVAPAPAPAPPPAPAAPPSARVGPARPRRPPAPPSRAPWIAVGAGLSALAAGGFVVAGVYYGLAGEAQAARNGTCPAPCDPTMPRYAEAAGQDQRYRDHLGVTTWSLVAAAALTAGAALWWVLARPTSRPVVPVVAALPGGGAVVGVAVAW